MCWSALTAAEVYFIMSQAKKHRKIWSEDITRTFSYLHVFACNLAASIYLIILIVASSLNFCRIASITEASCSWLLHWFKKLHETFHELAGQSGHQSLTPWSHGCSLHYWTPVWLSNLSKIFLSCAPGWSSVFFSTPRRLIGSLLHPFTTGSSRVLGPRQPQTKTIAV